MRSLQYFTQLPVSDKVLEVLNIMYHTSALYATHPAVYERLGYDWDIHYLYLINLHLPTTRFVKIVNDVSQADYIVSPYHIEIVK